MKLSLFKNSVTELFWNSILIVIDKMTKYAYFISINKETNSLTLVVILLQYVFAQHKLLKEIITNRDSKFISNFWQTLMTILEVKHKFSTIYHKKIDEQLKILNQIMKQYFKCYINYQQNNWMKLFSLAQIAYNESKNTTMQVTSYFVNYEKESNFSYKSWEIIRHIHEAEITTDEMQHLHEQLQMNIEFNNL